ncbi:MAG: type II secretion system protein, partial [Patescibacteria group bacterium]
MNYKPSTVSGFTIIELIVFIAIIGIMASVVIVAVQPARMKARDVKRKTDMAQIGRLLYSSSCYVPNAGAGDYDLADLVPELVVKYPQYAQFSSYLPKDPKTGSEYQTNYRYAYSADSHCVMYVNLENTKEPITLSGLTAPTVNTGQGVLQATAQGPNGTNIYYQIGK